MDTVFKVTSGVLITLVLSFVIAKNNKDISLLIIIFVCSGISISAIVFLEPILDFVEKLQLVGDLDNQYLNILLKCTGIGIVSEIAGSLCEDAGHASLSKSLKFLTSAIILSMSLPVFNSLLDVVQDILETA